MSEGSPTVGCFGEVLWDFLPDGLFPGGAPFNVSYHLHRNGARAHLISAVGRDLLGDEILRRLRNWRIETEGIARNQDLPTGYVRASLSAAGNATYEIATEVAWDQIMPGEETLRTIENARAFVFGSLAQRSSSNRAILDRLLAVLPSEAERVFDVNLRPPYDDLALVRELAHRASLLKLNTEEAARLVGGDASRGQEAAHAAALAAQTGCRAICITAGEAGAGLWRDGEWLWEPGRPVAVVDTVGAGDAFLAGFIAHRLKGHSDAESLARGCRLGEWVAGQRGATPAYSKAS